MIARCEQLIRKTEGSDAILVTYPLFLEELLDRYKDLGVYEIDKLDILKLDTFKRFGKPAKIASLFGGKDEYIKAVRELEDAIYMDLVG